MITSRRLFDFKCRKCNVFFEDLVYEFEKEAKCPNCGGIADRQISAPHIDWRHMGISSDFPTAAGKWEKMQWRRRRSKGDADGGSPQLKEF